MKRPYKIISFASILLILFSTFACKESKTKDNSFTLTVTGEKHFPEGARVMVYRPETKETPEGIEFLKTEKFTNGKFTLEGTVDDVHIVYVDVVPADDEHPLQRVTFPLEPGDIAINFEGESNFTFKGGKYGALLVNSYNENDTFKKTQKELLDFDKTVDFEDSLQVEKYYEINDRLNGIGQGILSDVVKENSDDSLLQLLAYSVGYDGDPKIDRNVVIENLAKKVGENHRQSQVSLLSVKMSREYAAAKEKVKVNDIIKDFEAKDLSGDTFHLANVLKDNKYVLVEFWASWCGPCRAEIPFMKTAYKQYNDNGFEIVSFSLDNKQEAWEKATEEEQLPWINTSDLLAYTSPVAKLYGVNGIPANYLVEASTGKIIAKDLRQENLDNKLAELLD